ncbi:MAG: disulfide bond formation protein DsbA, partial [Marinobacter sp. 34-60-7]
MIRIAGAVAVFLTALMAAPLATAQSTWEEGTHYRELSNPVRTASDSGVEVAEIFWYGCPHCYNFKPLAEAWEAQAPDYVNYVKLPAALGASWEPHAYAFYALEAMGQVDALHEKVFRAIHVDKQRLTTPEAIATWMAAQGVDREKFTGFFNSFAVAGKAKRATQLQDAYQVEGTPSL